MKPEDVSIFHITDVENLPGIIESGGLLSDAEMANREPAAVIGYSHIKLRRLNEIRVECCADRFVGEFVPFYFCPRSPMLYTINMGNTGREPGCQRTIVHLVSTVHAGVSLGRSWSISDGNAGSFSAMFSCSLTALGELNWQLLNANDWHGQTFQKSAEFLVLEFFPWTRITRLACHNQEIAAQVGSLLQSAQHRPLLEIRPDWYY